MAHIRLWAYESLDTKDNQPLPPILPKTKLGSKMRRGSFDNHYQTSRFPQGVVLDYLNGSDLSVKCPDSSIERRLVRWHLEQWQN